MIEVYTLGDSEKWDQIVKSFKNHDVYYLSGYVRAFYLHGDGQPLLIYYNDCDTRAINVVMKRDVSSICYFKDKIPPNKYFDFTTPYGYGGFIVEGKNSDNFIKEYEEFCINNQIVSEFVRFHPLLRNWENQIGLFELSRIGETVTIDCREPTVIWENFSSVNRNMIRKAKKSNLHVYWGRDPYLVDKFIKIYDDTMKKVHATDYYFFNRDFYLSVLEDLRYNSLWFYVKKDDEIIAMSIFLLCNNKMHYHLSASKKEYQKYAPTNLMLYEASMWAYFNSYEAIHLGGGLGAQYDSLYKFKKGFNKTESTEFYIGKRIYDYESYEVLMNLRLENCNNIDENYFPKYRG